MSASDGDEQPQLPAAVDWVMGMLEPGTKPGVFTFFKATTVALVVCIATMLYALDVPSDVKFHLRVFLGLSICLMCITIWFFNELQNAPVAAPAAAEEKKKEK